VGSRHTVWSDVEDSAGETSCKILMKRIARDFGGMTECCKKGRDRKSSKRKGGGGGGGGGGDSKNKTEEVRDDRSGKIQCRISGKKNRLGT